MLQITDFQKLGIGLVGFGVMFFCLGILLLFDKALMAIGNIFFITGLTFLIGLERTFRFFFQRHKAKATGFFLSGIFIVLVGYPMIGMGVELYGFFFLFRGFIPAVIMFMRGVPVIGNMCNVPGIRLIIDKLGESPSMV